MAEGAAAAEASESASPEPPPTPASEQEEPGLAVAVLSKKVRSVQWVGMGASWLCSKVHTLRSGCAHPLLHVQARRRNKPRHAAWPKAAWRVRGIGR